MLYYVPNVRHIRNPLLNTNQTQGHLHALLEPSCSLISEKPDPFIVFEIQIKSEGGSFNFDGTAYLNGLIGPDWEAISFSVFECLLS